MEEALPSSSSSKIKRGDGLSPSSENLGGPRGDGGGDDKTYLCVLVTQAVVDPSNGDDGTKAEAMDEYCIETNSAETRAVVVLDLSRLLDVTGLIIISFIFRFMIMIENE
jgi:hypothetical protein